MVSLSLQIKYANEGNNLAMDHAYDSDDDLPLVIDCSCENDASKSSPVTDDAASETHFGSINSADFNTTSIVENEQVILLDNRKYSTNNEELGHLEEGAQSSLPTKMVRDMDCEEYITDITHPSDTTRLGIKIDDEGLLVKKDSVDVSNGIGGNLSHEMGAGASSNDSQQFKCHMCSYKTSDETYFSVHKKTHRNKYRCSNCAYISSSAIKLLHHQKKRHMTLEDLLYYCGDCSFSNIKRVELIKHRREKHHRTKKSPTNIKRVEVMEPRHEEHHHTKKTSIKPTFKCPDCKFKTPTECLYKKHRSSEHKDLLINCDVCLRKFIDQDDFQLHKLVHTYKKTEEGLYKCRDCNYLGKNRHNVVYHWKVFHKAKARDNELTCELCDYKTSQNWRFEQHMELHHKNQQDSKG